MTWLAGLDGRALLETLLRVTTSYAVELTTVRTPAQRAGVAIAT